jgi:hypothetical protein
MRLHVIGKEAFGFVATAFDPVQLRGVEGALTDAAHGISRWLLV